MECLALPATVCHNKYFIQHFSLHSMLSNVASAMFSAASACLQEPALQYAASKGFLDMVELLFSKGADVNAEDSNVSGLSQHC